MNKHYISGHAVVHFRGWRLGLPAAMYVCTDVCTDYYIGSLDESTDMHMHRWWAWETAASPIMRAEPQVALTGIRLC